MVTRTRKGRVRISKYKRGECARVAERERQWKRQQWRGIQERKDRDTVGEEGRHEQAEAGHRQVISS